METQGGPALSDELLEQAGWLRDLARALCRDEQAALDLEQDTWLAALRGGAHARDARAWLGGVARRLAASRGRGEGRRDARERRAVSERPPETPDTADTLAAVELSARLARAVAGLDEPYRTTLALRYYEGLPPRRIAQRLGVDPRAVESRLRRGREKLREALDRDSGGREVWFGAALALGLAGDHGGRATVLVAAFALLATGATGIALHRARGMPALATVELTTPQDVRKAFAETVVAGTTPAVQDMELREAIAIPEAGLELVVAGTDAPLVGAMVRWRGANGDHGVESDSAGRLAFESDLGSLQVDVVVDATETTRRFEVTVPALESTRVEVPRRGGRVEGRVVDSDGRPVPFAEVLAWHAPVRNFELDHPDRHVEADANGHFELDDLGNDWGRMQWWCLGARAPGLATYGPLAGLIDPREPPSEVVLEMEPAWEIRGRVSDAAGRALAGVPLDVFHSHGRTHNRSQRENRPKWSLQYDDPRFALTSDEDGTFQFQITGFADDSQESWRLQANSPAHRIALCEIEGPGWIDLRLDGGSVLEGVVLDANGRPVQGAQVGLRSSEKREPVQTDAKGEFSFDGLGERAGALVSVRAEGHAIAVRSVDLPNRDGSLRIELEPECRIVGKVVDASGEPARPLTVRLEGDRAVASAWLPRSRGWQWEDLCMLPMTNSNIAGEFAFDSLYPGRYTLLVTDSMNTTVHAFAEVDLGPGSGSRRLEIRIGDGLERTLTVRGRVHDDVTGQPVDSFTVRGVRYVEGEGEPSQDVVSRSFRTGYGEFEITGLRPGFWKFRAYFPVPARVLESPEPPLQNYSAGVHVLDLHLAEPQGR